MSYTYQFQTHTFNLLPEKAVYWEAQNILIIADLHLGKASHFRKNGIQIPAKSIGKDYEMLSKLLHKYRPKRLLILGDLFHSEINNEWDLLSQFVKNFPLISFELVMGNHDIISEEKYSKIGLVNQGETLIIDKLIFTHEPLEIVPENCLNFCGHIHPGFLLQGIGRQAIKLPCFYVFNGVFILPAFGNLTGLHALKKVTNSEIFGVNISSIVKL